MAITPENYWPLGSTIQKTFTNLNVGSGYEHFGIMSVNPLDGHMIMVYRKGTAYAGSIGSIYIRYSGDGGANWSNESLLLPESNVDLRNIAGGYVSNCRIIVFYGRYQNSTTWLSISYVTSTNNGDSWSSPQSAYDQPGNTGFSPYGHIVDFGTGLLYHRLSFMNYQSTESVFCYYTNRGTQKLNVVYGLAKDLLDNGPSGWNGITIKEILNYDGTINSGYQSIFLPLNQYKGIGVCFKEVFVGSDRKAYPVIIFTNINDMHGVLTALGL